MGLFDKKYCDICGSKIGFLGVKKLEDGQMCKDCQKLLSPWFSDRRHSTVEEIKRQLAYREANKEKVAAFHVTRSFGSLYKVLLDDDKKQFIVTRYSDWASNNPDVVDFSALTGCEIKIDEDAEELMTKDADGNKRSYIPPRFEYDYDFRCTLTLNHPYFDDMDFETSSSIREQSPTTGNVALRVHGDDYLKAESDLNGIKAWANDVLGLAEEEPAEVPAPAAAAAPEKGLFTFPSLPKTREELLDLPGVDFKDPFSIAAAAVAAFTRFPEDPEACYMMLDAIKGPQPLSNTDKAFIKDRFFDGKTYVPRSYFEGAVPDNDYTPEIPYRIRIKESVHSRDILDQGYITLYVKSGGADAERPIVLRTKPSTGEWFLWNHVGILADIRVPKSADTWA